MYTHTHNKKGKKQHSELPIKQEQNIPIFSLIMFMSYVALSGCVNISLKHEIFTIDTLGNISEDFICSTGFSQKNLYEWM